MEDPQGQVRTLAGLLATGSDTLRDEIAVYLFKSAQQLIDATGHQKKRLMYHRLIGLVEKTQDDQDLVWQVVTTFMNEFREQPIVINRRGDDNRPDWQIFIDRPFPDRATSGMEYIVNGLMRAPAGPGGKHYIDADGKRPAVRLTSFDQPLDAGDEEEAEEITLHDLLGDEKATVAIAASEELLARQQSKEKLHKFAPRCALAIRNLAPDKRYAPQRDLAIAFLELVVSGRISDDEMEAILLEKHEGNEITYVINHLALSKLLKKFGYAASDKTVGKAAELAISTLASEISQAAAKGTSDV